MDYRIDLMGTWHLENGQWTHYPKRNDDYCLGFSLFCVKMYFIEVQNNETILK